MIGKLQGIVDTIGDDFIILDVAGVGYEVFATVKLISQVAVGDPLSLFTYTNVKEDSITLIGFSTFEEKRAFMLLTSVQGIGVKAALNILSSLAIDDIELALSAEDVSIFKGVSGVGPKLAQRIITELKGKSVSSAFIQEGRGGDSKKGVDKKLSGSSGKSKSLKSDEKSSGTVTNKQIFDDAVSALMNFGYKRFVASQAVSKAYNNISDKENLEIDSLIKDALKNV
jgi:Holliday junction DNA helicase RuvA